jgi:DNA-binding ferritin-like protein
MPIPAKSPKLYVTLLQPVLVAQVALYLAAKQAHWIVRGPQFASLHELFGQVADSAESAADTVAERIARTRLHFLHGVSATIGLPPFASGQCDRRNTHLSRRYGLKNLEAVPRFH